MSAEGLLSDFQGKSVLITGGTAGIGLATGLAFGRLGAHCTLTYHWGSTDDDEVRAAFAAAGAPEPDVVQADVANADDTAKLLRHMRDRQESVEVFVSNVAFGSVVTSLEDYSARALAKTIDYTAWPLVEYTRQLKDVFGRYPRYIVGLSSWGPDEFFPGYDFIAASKSVLETLCRYLSWRLAAEDVRVNVLRAHVVLTGSFHETFGHDFEEFARRYDVARYCLEPEEVAKAILALCSGLLDAVTGQVITVDHGARFSGNLMRLYGDRNNLSL